MHRYHAILLLVLLLLPILGHVGFFQWRKWQLRQEIKEKIEHGLPREELSLIKIPVSWLDEPPAYFQRIDRKEFRLHGEMYDIIDQQLQLDTLFVYCIADKKETILFAQLDDWLQLQNTHDPIQSDRQMQVERLLTSLFFDTGSQMIFIPQFSASPIWPPYLAHFPLWQEGVPCPPPELKA